MKNSQTLLQFCGSLYNPIVLQEKAGAEVGSILQEDNMLMMVWGQDECYIKYGFNLFIANQ
jgi:hypothetical protein